MTSMPPDGRQWRVGIDVTAAVTQGGGIGRYTRELVKAAVALKSEFHFALFSARPPDPPPVPDPVPEASHVSYRRLPFHERWLYRLWYRLRLPLPVQLATGRIQLFHSPDFVLPPLFGRIPSLLTVHDLSFIHFPEVYPPPLVAYLNQVVPWSIGRASHVLADSAATRQDLIALWQVPPEKITVLHAGVDTVFRPVADPHRREAVRRRYDLGDKPLLLAVGTLQPRKNYELLLRAFQPLVSSWPHHLVIAGGSGWLYAGLRQLIAELGLDERVHLPGFIDDADLPALYSEATLYLLPSLYEGFGLPLLEAMACGAPALAANTSSLPEVAGDAALLLDPRDPAAWTSAMHRLLLDRQARAAMTGAGFVQARRFTWRQAARQLLGLYRRLLDRSAEDEDLLAG